jgi:hypothetical protein
MRLTSDDTTGLANLANTREDTGIAEAVMDLQRTEHGYKVLLGAVSRLSMPSLLDFLR